jgi:ABC-type multidrug transport system fused ATPase/permease subunit
MNGAGVSATAMMARAAELLYWTPAYVIGVVFLAVLLVAVAVGHRIGTWLRTRHRTVASSELSTVQTALLGLLGLLLAFTYSFVASRWDARKRAVVDEADALGTAYLRTQFRSGPAAEQLRALLREYTRSRIVTDDIARTCQQLQAAMAHSQQVRNELWPAAIQLKGDSAPTTLDALLFASLNEVVDRHTQRWAAARDRLPVIILAMLAAVAVLSLGLVGFANGLTARRHSYFTVALAVVISAVLLVIIDLDRPGRGIVRVSQQPLIDALESMEADGPPSERPAPSGK